jgi:hypothetical protein
MHMSLEHVLDFLHQLGGYMRSYVSQDGSLVIDWFLRNHSSLVVAIPPQVISNRVSIWEIPSEKGGGFGLFYSMMFADGIAWTVLMRQAPKADDLGDELKALRSAPLDEYGAIVVPPDIGPLDVQRTYQTARQAISSGEVPADPGTPFIQFRRPNPRNFEQGR